MTYIEFSDLFKNEESCKQFLKEHREKQGLSCRKCDCKKHYWKADKQVWECSHCKYRMSLKAGTAMHGSKLSLKTWFTAYYFVLQTKKSYSSCEMQRLLGLKRYETVWYLIHRIRQQMSKHNLQQYFKSFFDNTPDFQIPVKTRNQKNREFKLEKAFVLKESRSLLKNKTKPDTFLIVALKNGENATKKDSRYRLLNYDFQNNYGFRTSNYIPNQNSNWVQHVSTNANRILDGIHHLCNPGLAQLYFDEYSFKFNYKKIKQDLKIMILKLFTEVGVFTDNHKTFAKLVRPITYFRNT